MNAVPNPVRRLRIGVDIDGVLYPFAEQLRRYAIDVAGYHPDLPEATSWHFHRDQWDMSDAEFTDLFQRSVADGAVFAHGDPYPGAREALADLADAGHTIVIVTARHVPGDDDGALVRAVTQQWLDTEGLCHHQVLYTDAKHLVAVDICVDDSVDQYRQLAAAGRNPWLFDRPWNRQAEARRIHTHGDFVDVVCAAAGHLS